MGRPPIGKQAMTGSERQRRYLERLLSGSKTSKSTETLEQELAQAKARIRELERTHQNTVQATAKQKEAWAKPSAQDRRILQLQDRIRELEALVLPLDDTQKDASRQYKRKVDQDYKARWRECETFLKQRTLTMDSKDYRLFIAGFHPDTSPEMRDKARDRFEKLYKAKVIRDHEKVKWP